MRPTRPFVIQFLASAAMMASAIFTPKFAKELGASNAEVGMIGAAYGFSIFLSAYFFGRASDMRDRRSFMKWGLLASTITFFLQIFAYDAYSLLVIRALAGFSIGIFLAPLIAYAFEAGGKLGAFSSYGALGWATGSIIAGAIAQQGETFSHIHSLLPFWEVFTLSSISFLASLFLSLNLPYVTMKRVQVPLFPLDLIRKNARIYLTTFLRHLGANSIWIIFPLYLTELGANNLWIGIIYFLNSGTQFWVMRRLDLKDDLTLVKSGTVMSAVAFFSYSLATNFYHIIPMQFMLAFSYSYLYVGSLLFITRTNEEKATCIGILNSLTSVSAAIGPLLGGFISQLWGFDAVMYFASFLAILGMISSTV